MADFRKWVLALAVAALFLSAVPASAQVTPSAQQIVCTTFAQPAPNRSEGIAELQGDIVLNCTGGTSAAAAAGVPTYNIQVTLNTNVTSDVVSGTNITEATMLIDNPTALNTTQATNATPAITGVGGAGVNYGNGTVANTFLGRRTANGTLLFSGIPIDPPGTTASRIIRITNVRGNASGTNGQPITAFITTQPAGASPATAAIPLTNPLVTIGVPSSTLTFAVRNGADGTSSPSVPPSAPLCASQNTGFRDDPTGTAPSSTVGGAAAAGAFFTLRYTENQIGGFKASGNTVLAAGAALESGTLLPSATFPLAAGSPALPAGIGVADSGTRLRAVITNVPANVRVYATIATTSIDPAAGRLALSLVSTDANGANTAIGPGAVIPAIGSGYAELAVNNGTATAVWEVTNNDATIIERASVKILLAYSANRPTAGTISVAGSLAPVSSNVTGPSTVADIAFPIPRFVDTGSATSAVTLAPCVTNMLFPFVTNAAGFDTGIAIANTTTDPFGTAAQSGTCTLNYYGTNTAGVTPPANTTQTVAAGGLLVGTLSGGGNLGFAQAAGFQGYMIAQCNFRYGHGFAFVSDVGARNLAMGYLALILDGGPRVGAAVTAESLGN